MKENWEMVNIKKEDKQKLKIICAKLNIKHGDYISLALKKEIVDKIKEIKNEIK